MNKYLESLTDYPFEFLSRLLKDIDKTNELRNRAKLKNETLNMFDRGDGFKTMEKSCK